MAKSTTIIIGGQAGTGSTTAAKAIAEKLNFEHVYGGGIFRRMAKQAGKPLETFMTDIADDPGKEKEVDRKLLERAARGNVVIESRVLGWLVPDDADYFVVWMTCDFDERVRRILERETFRSPAFAKEHVHYRDRIDEKRYQKLYGVDLDDHHDADLVIDTTKTPADRTIAKILEAYQKS